MKRNKAMRIKKAPVIFQVRSSPANFFRSIFSSFSGFRSVAVFFGLSAEFFLDVFFSLLAIPAKIIYLESGYESVAGNCQLPIVNCQFLKIPTKLYCEFY